MNRFRIFLSGLTALLIAFAAQAQQQIHKTYSGLYEGGKATYTYYVGDEGGRIFDGLFTYTSSSKSIRGYYKDNKKSGRWEIRSGSDVFVANFSEGKLNGPFEYTEYRGNYIDRKLKCNLKDNLVVNYTSSKYGGTIDAEGFPHGTWKRSYESGGNLYTDIEVYHHGFLLSKKEINESIGDVKDEYKEFRKEYLIRKEYLSDLPDFNSFIKNYDAKTDRAVIDGLVYKVKVVKMGYDYAMPMNEVDSIYNTISKIKRYLRDDLGRGMDLDFLLYGNTTFVPGKLIEYTDEDVPTEQSDSVQEDDEVYSSVEQMPRFQGGDAAMYRFIQRNLHYPPSAQENNIQGRVIVQFVVTKTGRVGEVKVVRPVDPDLDREAIRVVKLLPRFIPGRQNGQPVNVWYTMPIQFALQSLM